MGWKCSDCGVHNGSNDTCWRCFESRLGIDSLNDDSWREVYALMHVDTRAHEDVSRRYR